MARDREILRVAERLFYERGYGAVPVDLIGSEAGVTGPAIYSHFRGKADILAALYDQAMDRMLELAGPVRDDPREELEHLVRAHAGFVLDRRELIAIYLREGRSLTDEGRRRFRRRQRDYVDRWVDALEQLHPDRSRQELTSVAYGVIGLLMSATTWPRHALKTEDLDELLAQLALGAFAALAPERALSSRPRKQP